MASIGKKNNEYKSLNSSSNIHDSTWLSSSQFQCISILNIVFANKNEYKAVDNKKFAS
jgi:hypothetical protein